jgi:hypothetical protein
MPSYGTLDYQDGWLCIRETDHDNNQPILYIWYWPIEKTPLSWAKQVLGDDFIGRQVIRFYGHTWSDAERPATGRQFPLPQGGQTKALRVDKVDVPRPKVKAGTELRWYNGHWQKYLKSKGWVSV